MSDNQKAVKAQSLVQKAMSGLPVNTMVATRRTLEAEGHDDIDEIMNMPPPQPSPDDKKLQLETIKLELDAMKNKQDVVNSHFDNVLKVAQAESLEEGTQLTTYQAIVDDHVKVAGLEAAAKERSQQGGQNPQQVQPRGVGA